MTEILTTPSDLVEATCEAKQRPISAFSHPNSEAVPSPTKHDHAVSWQQALKSSIRTSRQLLERLGLLDNVEWSEAAQRDFPVFVPLEYVSRMETGNARDPLLLQVLASPLETLPGGLSDPVGDHHAEVIPGLLQKYQRRALLITSGACAIHCRYCFRRHFPYSSAPTGIVGWEPALDTLANDFSLDEVILSGGDPLTATDSTLSQLVSRINQIKHIQRIRIHTRFPVVIPSRVCDSLLEWVSSSKCAVYFVLHFNHATELDQPVIAALKSLRQAGATLLNQSVLLAGVNDSVQSQRELCLKLVDHHVLPYYLHQLDQVQGALHFQVTDKAAQDIIAELRRQLPGYAVPQLVREVAGQPHKTPI